MTSTTATNHALQTQACIAAVEFAEYFSLSLRIACAAKESPLKKVPIGENLKPCSIEKEFDQEGTNNGASGINLDYFGARYYDPVIGVWGSVDPAEQYWNVYSYCGNKPGTHIDKNGRRGVIFHLITGGYYSAKADFYRQYDDEAHNYAHDRLKYKLSDLDERPSRFSEAEWEGIKSHARADYYGHDDYKYGAGEPSSGSPLEALVYSSSGADALNLYQDTREGIAIANFQGNLTKDNFKAAVMQNAVEVATVPLVSGFAMADPTGITTQTVLAAKSVWDRVKRWFK